MNIAKQSLVIYDPPMVAEAAKAIQRRARLAQESIAKGEQVASEDALNSIIYPRVFQDGAEQMVSFVSAEPATILDVMNLSENLDAQLMVRKARLVGLCPIREDVFNQCFDELIRQIAVACVERGILLARIRDDIRSKISIIQKLYQVSVQYNIKKCVSEEQEKQKLSIRIRNLEEENVKLKLELQNLKTSLDELEKNELKAIEEEEAKQRAIIQGFKEQIREIKQSIQDQLKV